MDYFHTNILLSGLSDLSLGLCIIYFKRYDTYHDSDEVIFDMHQQYILSDFRPQKYDISTNFSRIFVF